MDAGLGGRILYEIEVKEALVRHQFPPSAGWKVSVHADLYERGLEGDGPADKKGRAAAAYESLRAAGAEFADHEFFGEADIVAEHPRHGKFVVEAAGYGRKAVDEAMFSCLGQLVSSMRIWPDDLAYALAAPDTPDWRRQLARIPWQLREKLDLHLFAVGRERVEHFKPGESV